MGFSLFEALQGDEGPLLGKFLGLTDDRGTLADYRALLEARGDPRGEVLRIQEALLAGVEPDAARALMQRLEALVADGDPTWWKLVDRLGRLRNCGQAAGDERVVRFAFACPNRWEALERTAAAGTRYCRDCRQAVHYCETQAEAEAHARAGRCITVPARIAMAAGAEATRHVTGRPDPVEYWGIRIFGR